MLTNIWHELTHVDMGCNINIRTFYLIQIMNDLMITILVDFEFLNIRKIV